MQGKRVDLKDSDPVTLRAGEYGFWQGRWYSRAPIGHISDLTNHTVTEHEDGTITVSPSILVSGYDNEKQEKTVWHGYLEHGVWREV
jgi:hypothetical protein